MKKYHVIYKITNKLNGKEYIGKHSTNHINDSYMGSGRVLLSALKKHGKENFDKEVLYTFDNEKDAYDKEAELVNEDYILREDTYNVKLGGPGGEVVDKIIKTKRKGLVTAIDKDGNIVTVTKEEFRSGNYVGTRKGTINIVNEDGSIRVISKKKYNPELHTAQSKGRKWSESSKQKKRNTILIHSIKEDKYFFVKKEDVDKYQLPDYEIKGIPTKEESKCKNYKHITSPDKSQSKMVKPEDLNDYLDKGWTLGRTRHDIKKSSKLDGSNPNAKKVTINNKEYSCMKDAVNDLGVSLHTIRRYMKNEITLKELYDRRAESIKNCSI